MKPATTLKRRLPGLAGPLLLAGALSAAAAGSATPAAAQSCATIGSSTYCGARGSHNTVGNTVIFNNGPAGRRVGDYTVTGTPPRTQMLRGAESRGLAGPRTFTGVGTAKPLGGDLYEARIAALRAEILAIEAQYRQEQIDKLNLTPAQKAAGTDMPPALVRALRLAQEARENTAGKAVEGN
ncbi:hypothetical protein [Pelagibius marinus]|uniref:hypothetical protein n=1 Tax=Pelagibius marinus TaxID=2762760 RepID=UPI001872D464|nr:hypothetical protein [Pelagibius marinus]